jgi:hypothetical protein
MFCLGLRAFVLWLRLRRLTLHKSLHCTVSNRVLQPHDAGA